MEDDGWIGAFVGHRFYVQRDVFAGLGEFRSDGHCGRHPTRQLWRYLLMDLLDLGKGLPDLLRRRSRGRRCHPADRRQGCGDHQRQGPAPRTIFAVAHVDIPAGFEIGRCSNLLKETREILSVYGGADATGIDIDEDLAVLTEQTPADVSSVQA